MIGGRFKVASVASVAAAGLFMGGVAAQSADLGGNCCADLEERVADLEATAARKGNRRVSLEVSGQVNRVVVYHDDSDSRVAQFTSRDNDGRSGSRFRFRGNANINADLTAGFLIEIGVDNNEEAASNARLTAANAAATAGANRVNPTGGVLFRHTMLFVTSKSMGTLRLGRTNTATEGITEICLGCAITPHSTEEGGQVSAIAGAALPVGIDGGRSSGVHYQTPTIAGFVASASWFHATDPGGASSQFVNVAGNTVNTRGQANNDGWDVALRYAGEFGAMRVAAGIGYREVEDGFDPGETQTLSGSASVMHVPTGLFLQGSAGQVDPETGSNSEVWYISGGIQQKFNSLGNTSFTVGYGQTHRNNATNPFHYGVGISQNIDAAAMDVYLNWKHYDADADVYAGGSNGRANVAGIQDEVDIITLGARIRF